MSMRPINHTVLESADRDYYSYQLHQYPIAHLMKSFKIPKGPAIVMGIVSSATLYAIFYSHFQQVRDKAVMRAGVERDKERIRLRGGGMKNDIAREKRVDERTIHEDGRR